VKVLIPSPLHSYTRGVSAVDVEGDTLAEVLAALDERFPGLRFRIVDEHDRVRRHIHFFVDAELVKRIDHPVAGGNEIMIVCALSGG
jgi:sulfur-carrier protein